MEQINENSLNGKFQERLEKLREHLESKKSVDALYLDNTTYEYLIEGKSTKLTKIFLDFYAPDEIFNYRFDAENHLLSNTPGQLEIVQENEHQVIVGNDNRIFCTGYKKDNSTDFILIYFLESKNFCNLHIDDPLRAFRFDLWSDTDSLVDFVSLFSYLSQLIAAYSKMEESFDETHDSDD